MGSPYRVKADYPAKYKPTIGLYTDCRFLTRAVKVADMDRGAGRGEKTRQHILATAIRLFAEQGYDGLSIDMVLRESGVSRGSLYYYFVGKEALFAAALEATEARIAATVVGAAQNVTDPLSALKVGCRAWINLAAADQAVRQIALIDAPSVVGWGKWREIDAQHGLGLLKRSMEALASIGAVSPDRTDFYAHSLLAMLSELALVMARASSDESKGKTTTDALDELLDRLFRDRRSSLNAVAVAKRPISRGGVTRKRRTST